MAVPGCHHVGSIVAPKLRISGEFLGSTFFNTNIMNPIAILAAAQRSNAVYLTDKSAAQSAFEALGMTFLGQYQDTTHQGVVSKDAKGLYYVTIAGTRFHEGYGVDVFTDLWLAPVNAPKGGQVPSGVYSGMKGFWNWALSLVPPGTVLNIEGHSLGAERALLSPLFLSKDQIGEIHAFEPPQCGTQEYWDAYRDVLATAVVTVNGADILFGYPPRQGYVHDAQGKFLWFLPSGTIQSISATQWPGGTSYDDHSLDLLITRIQDGIKNARFPHL